MSLIGDFSSYYPYLNWFTLIPSPYDCYEVSGGGV